MAPVNEHIDERPNVSADNNPSKEMEENLTLKTQDNAPERVSNQI